jgi:hypothetical protein
MAAITGDQGNARTRRVTGGSALAAGLLLLGASPLYVVSGRPPSLADAANITRYNSIAFTTKLVGTVYVIGFIVFISGFRQLILNPVIALRS